MAKTDFATVEDALESIDTLTERQTVYENSGNPSLPATKQQEIDSLAARLDISEAWQVRERARKERIEINRKMSRMAPSPDDPDWTYHAGRLAACNRILGEESE